MVSVGIFGEMYPRWWKVSQWRMGKLGLSMFLYVWHSEKQLIFFVVSIPAFNLWLLIFCWKIWWECDLLGGKMRASVWVGRIGELLWFVKQWAALLGFKVVLAFGVWCNSWIIILRLSRQGNCISLTVYLNSFCEDPGWSNHDALGEVTRRCCILRMDGCVVCLIRRGRSHLFEESALGQETDLALEHR